MKWKRLHSRAKLDDLKESLRKINREDAIRELERSFNQIKEKKKAKR